MSRILGYSALVVWLGHFYFWYSYFDSSPKQPNYANGHIIPVNNHGSVRYLTVRQDKCIVGTEIAAFALFAVGFLTCSSGSCQ
jgi:hypothetical protein